VNPLMTSGRVIRPLITVLVLLAAWWAVQAGFGIADYLLPSPAAVARALWQNRSLLAYSTLTTLAETLLGLLIGGLLGAALALAMAYAPPARRWLMPLVLLSQAIPVFALAPLLVLWFGFGMASKVAMTTLVIFFPITAACFDGLRRTEPGLLDLARTMGAGPWRTLWHLRLPAALPVAGAGLRVATAIAPIGAVIGEWVGASSGLGYVMQTANTRIETALMFAALAVLSTVTILLWWLVDQGLHRLLRWAPDSDARAG
jgi:putative hydroxymethylpyrimidine transport system permease protein